VDYRRLGDAGIAWLRSSLEDGLSMAREVLRSIKLEEGEAYAIIPPHAPSDVLYDFEEGGKGLAGSDEVLIEAFTQVIGDDTALLVVEDERARPNAPFLERSRSETMTLGEEVYHWFVLRPGNVEEGMDFFSRSTGGYPTNAVISSPGLETRLCEAGAIRASHVELLVQNLRAVIVSAYDNEGYVLWMPDSRRNRSSSGLRRPENPSPLEFARVPDE
jgi:hypothetical protein